MRYFLGWYFSQIHTFQLFIRKINEWPLICEFHENALPQNMVIYSYDILYNGNTVKSSQ